ncbi:Kinase [Hexamita inflata]|uniref:CAMK CAMK1 n=1 Tax=Hexamita inflata TaxID=28002 RepID=A0AA86R7I1_9EUKA|nr:CAMK CAMK1 [Hexamita inflata]
MKLTDLDAQPYRSGGFGEIYTGTYPDGQPVIIKKLSRTNKSTAQLAQIQLEMLIMKRCKHENIIRLIDYICEDENLYLIMERATGGTLMESIVSRQHYSEYDARYFIQQILSAFNYLHRHEIAHLDFKPDNVVLKDMINQPGYKPILKLIDFGSCKFGQTQFVRQMTQGYASPEQLLKKEATVQSDMFSLGVVTYIILSGAHPFDFKNPSHMNEQIIKGQWSWNPAFDQVSDFAKDFITRCLKIEPSERMTSKNAMRHAWIENVGLNFKELELSRNQMKQFMAVLKLKSAFLVVKASIMVSEMVETQESGFVESIIKVAEGK